MRKDLLLPEMKLLPILESTMSRIYEEVFGVGHIHDYEMSLFKVAHFINLRNERSEDLSSVEVKNAMEIKANFFPLGTPRFLICIDGRVLTKLIACFHGNAYHVPAGDTKIDFLPVKDAYGQLFLRSGLLSKIIDKTVQEQGFLHEVLDSHLHCAAGGLGANDRHCCEVSDAGLWDDVVRKSEMKKAIIAHGRQKYPTLPIFVTQMSFNPDDGYSFFGLEKKECLQFAKECGYTNEVIEDLSSQGLLISTKKLAEEKFTPIFLSHYFNCNYPKDYCVSTENFWINFEIMAPDILPELENIVRETLNCSDDEVKQTAALIMASAYNGFLHNHNADGTLKSYPYATHRESVITVTISEKGPFSGAESFFVHPDSPSISSEIKLGRSLIVGNRQKKRMSSLEIDAVNTVFGDDYNDYMRAPVLSFFFQRTSRELTAEEVNKLQEIDWSDVVDIDWFNLSNEDFLSSYLEKKWPYISAAVSYAINRLRQQAINIYEPSQSATEDFLAGRIIPIWAIAGPNRQILSIIQFVINGYKE